MADNERYDLFGSVGLDMAGWDNGMSRILKDSGLLNAKWLAAGGAIAAVAAGLVECVRESASFESAMSNIETVVGKGNDSFLAQLADDVKSLSKTMPFSQTELAGTLYDIISYGVPAADAMDLLKTSAETAVGGFANVNDTFKLFGSIIKGYGLEWEAAAEVSDKMFFIAARGASTISELASSIGGVVPFAKNLGVTLNEVYAVMSTLPGVTGTTSEAATQLTSVMVALLDPSKQMKKVFNDLGVASGQDLITKMGGLQGALMALEKYAKQHNMAIGEMLGRKEAQLAFFNLVGTQAGEYAKNLQDVATSTGLAKDAFAVKSADMTNQWKILMNEIKLLMSGIGDAAMPLAKVLIEVGAGLTKTVSQIGQVLGYVDKFITGWTVKYFENAKSVFDGWGKSLGLVSESAKTINRELLLQKEAAQETADRGFAPLWKELDACDAYMLSLNTKIKKNIELTKEQKEAVEYYTAAQKRWKEVLSLKEIEDISKATGELRGNWKEIPELITSAGEASDNSGKKVKKLGEEVNGNGPNWIEWAGQLRTVIGNIDGLSASTKALLSDIAGAGAALLKGDLPGAIASVSAQILNQVVIPAGKAIQDFLNPEVNLHVGEFRQADTPTNYIEVLNEALKNGDDAMADWARTMMGIAVPAFDAVADATDYLGGQVMPKLSESVEKVDKDWKDSKLTLEEYTERLREAEKEAKADALGNMGLVSALKEVAVATEKADDDKGRHTQTLKEYQEELRQTAKEEKALALGIMGLTGYTNEYAAAVEKADDDKGRHNQTLEEYQEELRQAAKEAKAEALGIMGIADATVYTTDKVKEQIYTVGKFELAWENMLKTTLDLWDEWEKDTRTIFAGLEKMLYFKVDVDTTTADEQIAASIGEMMAYAESLNKTSDAYKDIQNNITEMLIQYAATGASASDAANGLALQIINIRNAIDEAADPDARDALQKQLDSMIEKFRTIEDVITTPWKLAVDTNDAKAKMQAFYDAFVPNKSDDPDKMHTGGFPRTAHSGYLASSEVDVRMLKNEMVLRPEATDKFGAGRLIDFNKSLDPSVLGGQRPVKVVFHNATKQSWAEIVDDSIYPRMKEKERRFEVAGNPY